MKKLLIVSCLFFVVVAGFGKSCSEDGIKTSCFPAIHQYVMKNIVPVLNEKRLAFDASLSEAERTDVSQVRQQMLTIHERTSMARMANSGSMPERAASLPGSEARQLKHRELKELKNLLHTIALNHQEELTLIFNDLKPQIEQWVNDLSKLIPDGMQDKFRMLHNVMDPDNGMLKMWSRVGFLLLNPSKAITPDSRSEVAASEILPASFEESVSLFPNPAVSNFTLNLDRVPVNNKLIITNMEGKIMMEKENLTSTESVDCSLFPSGVYFVQLRSGDELVNRKLIINR